MSLRHLIAVDHGVMTLSAEVPVAALVTGVVSAFHVDLSLALVTVEA